MNLHLVFDHTKGIRGRLVLAFTKTTEKGEEVLDQEVILKHPFLLRIRLRRALIRICKRQKKMKLFMNNPKNKEILESILA